VSLDDLSTHSESDAGARNFSAVKTLEGREDALLMAGFNSQAVVFYSQDALAFMRRSALIRT
jgi:hypothetical protein